MDPKHSGDPIHPNPDSAADRLESWKEIAAYLRRDVRTVQRWHDRAGLPIHRHVDAKQRGVFAFRRELDGWANQSRSFATGEPAGHTRAQRRLKLGWWTAAGVTLCAVAVAVAWRVGARSHWRVHGGDEEWVLVGAFDNRTGDETLDDSLQFVLERELSASPGIQVVTRPRVQDVLRLMRRPGTERLTPALAREVALRDGAVRGVIAGRVECPGSDYMLSVDVVDPQTGSTVASGSIDVKNRAALLSGVKMLAERARDALGQSAVPSQNARLPQVTTTSLAALQLYARAEDALSQDHLQAARVLLESALREDPEFALAHSWLAVMLRNDPDARALAPAVLEHEQRALALATQATERERLHIVGTYQLQHSEPARALATWEALARIDTGNWLAHHYMSNLYYRLRRIPEALREAERVAEMRPHDFRIAVYTAQSWVLWGGDPDRAKPYVDRARALWPAQQSSFASELRNLNLPPEHARAAAWVLLFPAYDRWRQGDLPGMLQELRRVLESNPLASPVDRDALFTIAIGLDMSAGRLHDARELTDRLFQKSVRELHLAVLADAVDNEAEMRRHMRRVPVQGEQRALRFVRAGLWGEAESIIAQSHDAEGYTDTARGELALRRGRASEAVEDLQHGIELASSNTLSERYLGAESLATALERLNRRDEALKALEAAAAEQPRYTRTGPSGAFWLRVLARLSQTYRERGRNAEADAVDSRLRRLLGMADTDHPLVVQLSRRSAAN